MCGRYLLETSNKELTERFQAQPRFSFDWSQQPRTDDIAPGRNILVVRKVNSSNELDHLLWGWWFFKRGAKGQKVKQLIINSREDTILKELDNPKKIYRESLSLKRVLIPAQGFYEWPVLNGKKIKTLFKVKSEGDDIFSFGGFTTFCKQEDGLSVETAVIITVAAQEQMKPFHDRQPLIIRRDRENDWLSGSEGSPEFLQSFFDEKPIFV